MTLLAALAVGLCCALVAAALSGTMPPASTAVRPTGPLGRTSRTFGTCGCQQAGVGLGPPAFFAGSAFAGLFALLAIAALTGSVLRRDGARGRGRGSSRAGISAGSGARA